MPNPNTVTMQTPDGKQYSVPSDQVQNMQQRFQAKLVGNVGEGVGAIRPWERRMVSGMGFDADKIATAGGVGAQWAEIGKEALSGIEGIPGWMLSTVKDPLHLADPVANPAMKLKKALDEGDYATALGALSAMKLGSDAVKGEPGTLRYIANKPLRYAGRAIVGAGKEEVAKAASGYMENLNKIRQKTSSDIAESSGKAVERSKAESGAAVKESVTPSAAKGPVFQRLQTMTDTAVKDAQDLDSRIRGTQNQHWNTFRAQVGSPDVNLDPVVKAEETARRSMKTPEDLAAFDRAIRSAEEEAKEVGARSLSAKEAQGAQYVKSLLDKGGLSVEEIKQHLPQLGYTPKEISNIFGTFPQFAERAGGTVDFGTARSRFTKLGEKLQGTDGVVYRGLKQVQDAYDNQIKGAIGPAFRSTYERLKADWSQYLTDFRDPNGAFTKLFSAPSAIDRINTLSGKWGKEIMDAMTRYGDYHPNPQSIASIRALNRQIESLPGSVPAVPEPVGKPSLPPPFDPVAVRRSIIEGHTPGAVTPSRFMLYQIMRALVRKGANVPTIKDWLSGEPK